VSLNCENACHLNEGTDTLTRGPFFTHKFQGLLQALWAFARSRRVAAHAAAMGGYDLAGLGTVSWNDPQ
ncbi:MAG: hypothetical protein H7Y14_04995, partial [Burkholderiales bacterium]|nr:hypothetical protein [Burkholderiales bacterium]